jgi:GNAT superfamily N-acetyltransferase
MTIPATLTDVMLRDATPDDAPAFLALVHSLAEFEKLPGPDEAAARRLCADAFGPAAHYHLTLAEVGGAVVAYAVTFRTYSTFLARPTLYLEDLFVHPDHRRRGIATALLRRLARRAADSGCGRFEWMVLDWNQSAQEMYRQLGARELPMWRLFRLEGADLQALADTEKQNGPA